MLKWCSVLPYMWISSPCIWFGLVWKHNFYRRQSSLHEKSLKSFFALFCLSIGHRNSKHQTPLEANNLTVGSKQPWSAPMYKRQADPISFPGPDRWYQYASPSFFSIKNFIWPPDPLNKGKIDLLLHFWALWSFYYKNTSKKNAKTRQKSQKHSCKY